MLYEDCEVDRVGTTGSNRLRLMQVETTSQPVYNICLTALLLHNNILLYFKCYLFPREANLSANCTLSSPVMFQGVYDPG